MKFICDGHEYTTRSAFNPCTAADTIRVRNNYGETVAQARRDETQEYWTVINAAGDEIARRHENDAPDNTLEQWAVWSYVAWATDNDTVEDHGENNDR